jgi:hypothetical protein
MDNFRNFDVFVKDQYDLVSTLELMRMIRIGMLLCCLFLACTTASAQSLISGQINTIYRAVSSINIASNTVTTSTAPSLAIGDTVLLIQMKGATISRNNDATFGNVTSLGSAGAYELNIVCGVNGNEVTLERNLSNTYDVTGYVQLIRVPNYQNVIVSGMVTGQAWNGSTGGVLVMRAAGWIRMNQDFNMNGAGFRGGWDHSNYAACNCTCGSGQFANFFFNSANCRGADKGEGIADSLVASAFGKGKESNGGGGGNDHNAGGAGGGNYGAGGNGGLSNNNTCVLGQFCHGNNPGVGGLSLNTAGFVSGAMNRIFMGGGGGSGHDNNGTGTPGTRGGGIIILMADSINLNGLTIFARGVSVPNPQATSDGSGGGGAGGTVILDVRAIRDAASTINVSGGNGGSDTWTVNTHGCKGPGGGGGGGLIWSRNTLPVNVNKVVNGGANGNNCSGANGAQPGGTGGLMTGMNMAISSVINPICILPVEYQYFEATLVEGQGVRLDWATASEIRNNGFEIQRSTDGIHFSSISTQPSRAQNGQGQDYTAWDATPQPGSNWYRLKQLDIDGRSSYSEVRVVVAGAGEFAVSEVYPNPVSLSQSLRVNLYAGTDGQLRLTIRDVAGRGLYEQKISVVSGLNELSLPTDRLSSGTYMLEVQGNSGRRAIRRFQVVAE